MADLLHLVHFWLFIFDVKHFRPCFLGVFIMVLAGIGGGIIIIVLEIIYHKQRGWRADQRDLAKKTADVWKSNVQVTRNHVKETNGVNGKENGHVTQEAARANPVFVTDAQL